MLGNKLKVGLFVILGLLAVVVTWRLLATEFHLSRTVHLAEVVTPVGTATASAIIEPTVASAPSLGSLALGHGILIGSAVSGNWLTTDKAYAGLVSREFTLLTPENSMKFEVIHPALDRYDFFDGDLVVKFAQQNGLRVRGHTLVWFNQLPKWVTDAYKKGSYTREQWINILRDHIYTVVGHYKGKIYAWDVVNEAISDQGLLLDSLWLDTIGPDYIALAFQWAHEADPQALLFYNDFSGEGMNIKSQTIYSLMDGLLKAGVPVDGIGMQMHISLVKYPAARELAANMRRLEALGLQVHITEMDVRIQDSSAPMAERLATQAAIYKEIYTVCMQAPNCTAFSTWGLTDAHSWIPSFTGHADAPLLFDQNGQPKPAYKAIINILKSSR